MESESPQHCRNCGQPLGGEYCAQCGQRERGRELRLWDLFAEAFEDLSQLDGRIWRTLGGLLLRPGRVTADYLAGHRAHYIPPLRLYLIISFAVFLLISLSPVDVTVTPDPQLDTSALAGQRAGVYVPREDEHGETELLTLKEFLGEQRLEVEAGEAEMPDWMLSWLVRLEQNAGRIESDPSLFLQQLLQRLPQMMFLLLPLFAGLLKLAYLFSPYHYLQHLIFSLHYHSTAFLYFILLWPGKMLLPGDYGGFVMLALLIYLPIAMARVYGSKPVAAAVKGLLLGLSYYFVALTAGALFLLVNLALM